MVTVVALREFRYGDRDLQIGEAVDMEPVQASVHAFAQRVSLLARPTYHTRDMVAQAVPDVVLVTADAPVKRRRGRPRKTA